VTFVVGAEGERGDAPIGGRGLAVIRRGADGGLDAEELLAEADVKGEGVAVVEAEGNDVDGGRLSECSDSGGPVREGRGRKGMD
jgi:hypothetical protein